MNKEALKIRWTPEALAMLGVRTDAETAGSIFGLSRTQSYEAIRAGRFPVPVVRIGRRIVVPVAPILRALGLDGDATASPAAGQARVAG